MPSVQLARLCLAVGGLGVAAGPARPAASAPPCALGQCRAGQPEETSLLQRSALRALAPPAPAPGRRSKFFVWLSDAHADPQWGSDRQYCINGATPAAARGRPYGMAGCDPPGSLVSSAAAAAAAEAAGAAEFVLFTGDFPWHSMQRMPQPAETVRGVVRNVSAAIRAAFPGTPAAFGPLGNNDNPQNYYQAVTTPQAEHPWFSAVGQEMRMASVMNCDEWSDFKYGSYYETNHGNLTILSIATVYYSVGHVPESPKESDPFRQFSWLRERLQAAADAGTKVWIVGHIPPGIETYGSTALWRPEYVEAYLAIVQDPVLGSCIAAQLFGHVHKDEFRYLPKIPAGAGPMLLTASISPVYYNWPTFKLVEYDPETKRLLNYRAFYVSELPRGPAQPPQWKFGYDLLQTYPQLPEGGLLMADFKALTHKMQAGLRDYDWYAKWYTMQYPNTYQKYATTANNSALNQTSRAIGRHNFLCAARVTTYSQYVDCTAAKQGARGRASTRSALRDIFHDFPYAEIGEENTLAIGRLLHWAAQSTGAPLSHDILGSARACAARGDWRPFLATYSRYLRYGSALPGE